MIEILYQEYGRELTEKENDKGPTLCFIENMRPARGWHIFMAKIANQEKFPSPEKIILILQKIEKVVPMQLNFILFWPKTI